VRWVDNFPVYTMCIKWCEERGAALACLNFAKIGATDRSRATAPSPPSPSTTRPSRKLGSSTVLVEPEADEGTQSEVENEENAAEEGPKEADRGHSTWSDDG
jgi:hypothetical protein